MRIVITGGTGFVGRALATALAARGDSVTILSRGDAREIETRVRSSPWTPQKAGEWQREVEEADAVVGLAGAGVLDEKWTEARKEELRASRVVSTGLVAEAIARAAKKPVFVSASAVGIYGMHHDDRAFDEDGAHGSDVLASLCEAWEAATAPAAAAGARVALARIGIVLGPGGGALERMLAPFRAFVGGPIGSGTQVVSWIHVEDTVRALTFAIDQGEMRGPFNVTAPSPVTMNELARAIGVALGRPAFMRVPAFAIRAALGARAEVVLSGQRALPRRLLDAGFAFSFPSLAPALADILAQR